jgi:iron complex transport system permease protein
MRLLSPQRLLFFLAILLPSCMLLSMIIGPVNISLSVLWNSVFGNDYNSLDTMILTNIRIPRVLLGACVGATLACCGAVLQGLFRNPLADPTLIGVSAGASAFWGMSSVAIAAFTGGVITALLVYRLASGPEGTSVATMLLAGIAISALAGAINSLLSFFSDDESLRRISLWQMGNLDAATWQHVWLMGSVFIALIVAFPRDARGLNAMLLGESEARHLGIEVEWMKRRLIIFTALGIGVSVAVVGMVAFVGLVVPHLVRLLIGPDHRYLIPASAMVGAVLLILADTLARIIVAPAELPAGVITALLGAPFFVSLLIQQRRVI